MCVSLCLIMIKAMKMYGRTEVQLHVLIKALDGYEWV